jgi:hypothetical protein
MRVRRLDPAVRERQRSYAVDYERMGSYQGKWRKDNPEKYRAQNAVSNAVRDGKLIKGPCAVCGATKRIHGHHEDYSKPLQVTWLCAVHHKQLHIWLDGK